MTVRSSIVKWGYKQINKMRILRKVFDHGQRALQDLKLLRIVQSEIAHELSTQTSQQESESKSHALEDFEVEWDSPESRDVVLRRKCETGEEVVISALLGPPPLDTEAGDIGWDVLMKICVKKPGLRPMLQFDCQAFEIGDENGSNFDIHNASYLNSSSIVTGDSAYRGPSFSHLDPRLQLALKDYLVAKGIGEGLTNFLIQHLQRKEQGQYIDWLTKLESSISPAT